MRGFCCFSHHIALATCNYQVAVACHAKTGMKQLIVAGGLFSFEPDLLLFEDIEQ